MFWDKKKDVFVQFVFYNESNEKYMNRRCSYGNLIIKTHIKRISRGKSTG